MKNAVIKALSLFMLAGLFTGCFLVKKSTGSNPDVQNPGNVEQFLAEFEKAVITHNAGKLMKLMDADYVKAQHDEFLKGNTTQFLNEFFCGNKVDGSGFECLNFNEIKSLTRVELSKTNSGYDVTYEIFSNHSGVKRNWTITIKDVSGKAVLGFYGASG